MTWYYHLSTNPEPWAVGEISVGRKNNKTFGRMSPNHQVVAFKEAVAEELEGIQMLPKGQYKLTFYLWRQQAEYISETDRRVLKHIADATNMQKSLEDALQGILFKNDRDVQDIRTVIVAQGRDVTPHIIIKAELFAGLDTTEISEWVWIRKSELQSAPVVHDPPAFDPEDLF